MKFDVDTGQVSRTVSELSELLLKIENGRESMYNALEALDVMWAGQAHDAFKVQYVEDDKMMGALLGSIREAINNIDSARQEYVTCEDEVKQMVSSIRI